MKPCPEVQNKPVIGLGFHLETRSVLVVPDEKQGKQHNLPASFILNSHQKRPGNNSGTLTRMGSKPREKVAISGSEVMPRIRNPYTGQMQAVSMAVQHAGRPGPKRDAYCARTAKIPGNWKRNPRSKNLIQRRRWRCPYVPGELTISEYRRGR